MDENQARYVKKLEKEIKDLRERNASQLDMYEMTTLYLKKLQDELEVSEKKLSQTNKNLIDSINYAKHIQDAFVVRAGSLRMFFPKSFIFEKPKDIVSGDFVWAFANGDFSYLAAGDCTGHGVPGAMLSIFIISMLNQVANQFENPSPAGILGKLDKLIQKYLSQYSEQIKDSVEISLARFDMKNLKLEFSGAKRPLVHARGGLARVHKGSARVLGDPERRPGCFESTELDLRENDLLYMFSDGFADQFGGLRNKKFSSRKLVALLAETSGLPMGQQQEALRSAYEGWKGPNGQIDDVLLVGVQI